MPTSRPTAVTAADGVAPWLTLVASEAPLLPAVADAVRYAQAATPPPSATNTARKVISRRLRPQRPRGPGGPSVAGKPPRGGGGTGGSTTRGPARCGGATT